MPTPLKTTARCLLAALLLAGAGACDANLEASAPVDAPEAVDARIVDALPLRSGYYVSSDTPCAEASNATLHVMHEDGQGYGGFTTPPYTCVFLRIEQVGPSRYRVQEACGDAHGDDDAPAVAVSLYEVMDETRYRATREDGWTSESRRCPRSGLPALWRDADVGGYVD